MNTEEIFSKLNIIDYNNILEEIIENKLFSEETKNILLSMLYKIENSYSDYKKVKRIVLPKKMLIEEILSIIENKCVKIIVAKPNSLEAKELKKRKLLFAIDRNKGFIITYPKEEILLKAIYEIAFSESKIGTSSQKAFSYIWQKSAEIANTEVIRDFNGWNWSISNNEVEKNLFYKIQLMLIVILKENYYTSVLKQMEILKATSPIFFNILELISIALYLPKNRKEKEQFILQREIKQKQLDLMRDKKSYIENICLEKKKALIKIKKLKEILSSRENMEKEFIRRNQKRNDDNKLLNLSSLDDEIEAENKELDVLLSEYNQILNPNGYDEIFKEKSEELENLKLIGLGDGQKTNLSKIMKKLENTFLSEVLQEIDKINEKKQAFEWIYFIRYITQYLKETNNLKCLQNKLIEKLINLKNVVILFKDNDINALYIKQLFETKMIDLEKLYIKFVDDNEQGIMLQIYDDTILEKEFKFSQNLDDGKLKINKRIKLLN